MGDGHPSVILRRPQLAGMDNTLGTEVESCVRELKLSVGKRASGCIGLKVRILDCLSWGTGSIPVCTAIKDE